MRKPITSDKLNDHSLVEFAELLQETSLLETLCKRACFLKNEPRLFYSFISKARVSGSGNHPGAGIHGVHVAERRTRVADALQLTDEIC